MKMPSGRPLLFIALFLGSNALADPVRLHHGKVTQISDGDTIRFLTDETAPEADAVNAALKVRLIGIDTPESRLPVTGRGTVSQGEWGKAAGAALKSLIPPGTRIELADYGMDKNQRVLGRILLNGEDINLRMVREGWAIPYFFCSGKECNPSYADTLSIPDYARACAKARKEGLGIFRPSAPLEELPYDFRRRMANRTARSLVGDVQTRDFVGPENQERIDACRRVFFLKPSDAVRAGYRRAD